MEAKALTTQDLTEDLVTTELTDPALTNPDLADPDLPNPDLAATDLASTELTDPDLASTDLAGADLQLAMAAQAGAVTFEQFGVAEPICAALDGRGDHQGIPDPGADPADRARPARRHRPGADRHGQDAGIRASRFCSTCSTRRAASRPRRTRWLSCRRGNWPSRSPTTCAPRPPAPTQRGHALRRARIRAADRGASHRRRRGRHPRPPPRPGQAGQAAPVGRGHPGTGRGRPDA